MPFTVVWIPYVEDDLTLLWMQAPDKQAVSDAANRIERALRTNPDTKGWLQDGFRYYVDRPLCVAYEISQDDRLVTILQVTRF